MRHPVCDSAFCKECRTEEGEILDFYADVRDELARPLTAEEERVVAFYLETPHEATTVARIIRARAAAGITSEDFSPLTNYGAY